MTLLCKLWEQVQPFVEMVLDVYFAIAWRLRGNKTSTQCIVAWKGGTDNSPAISYNGDRSTTGREPMLSGAAVPHSYVMGWLIYSFTVETGNDTTIASFLSAYADGQHIMLGNDANLFRIISIAVGGKNDAGLTTITMELADVRSSELLLKKEGEWN